MVCRAAEGSIGCTWLRVVAAIVDRHSGAVGVVQPRKRAASEKTWAWVLSLPYAVNAAHWANEAWVLDPPDSYANGEEQGDEARDSKNTTLEPAPSGGRRQAGAALPTPTWLFGGGTGAAGATVAAGTRAGGVAEAR